MLSRGRRCSLLALLISLMLGAVAARAAEEPVVETYPDGAKKASFTVNANGEKHGLYQEFFPEGKRKLSAQYVNGKRTGTYTTFYESGKPQLRAGYLNDEYHGKYQELTEEGLPVKIYNYRNGKLHGPVQEFVGKNLTKDEYWSDGQLLLPRSQAQIATQLTAIHRMPIVTEGEFPTVMDSVKSRLNDSGIQKEREEAVRNLNGYRYICGLAYDVGLDRTYIAHAEAGSDILKAIGKLDHTPANPGWPEAEYKFAYKGTSSSNLHSGGHDTAGTVHSYMNDSDAGNIKALGHRRWCLNPHMQKTGFGRCDSFSAMWSFDGSRKDVPDWDHVAFPPQGLIPNVAFKDGYAWSVTLNPKKYKSPEENDVKVKVTQAKLNLATGNVEKASKPMELDYYHVDHGGYGVSNCIIFRPAGLTTVPGAAYWCEITGLKNSKNEEATLEYFVGFFKL